MNHDLIATADVAVHAPLAELWDALVNPEVQKVRLIHAKVTALFVVACALGCATAQPLVISDQQRKRFEDVVRAAEAAGAVDGPPTAAARLAEAKSEFEYSQHLPMHPDRARQLAEKAQADAELALQLAQSGAATQLAATNEARPESAVGAEAP